MKITPTTEKEVKNPFSTFLSQLSQPVPNPASADAFEESTTKEELDSEESESSDELEESSESEPEPAVMWMNLLRGTRLWRNVRKRF
ncbi:hypothetical protein ACH5RR_039324 [Cinchona calisaya]|uniref:Uncharacterized protein n=1 Tax=Cinchona calisaya TaxID=153742 RepID=A0ABD2Y0F6_9GENT